MKQTLVKAENKKEGTEWFLLTSKGWESLGVDTGCVGPWGTSSGVFAEAETTHPLTEWAEKNGFQLFWNSTLTPVWCGY